METIGLRMKRLRTLQGMSASEVAIKSGVPISTYREWENGRQIKGEPYKKIADTLNVSLYELLTGCNSGSVDLIQKIDDIQNICTTLKKDLESIFENK